MYRLLMILCLIPVTFDCMALRPTQPQHDWDSLRNECHRLLVLNDSMLMVSPAVQIKTKINLRLDRAFSLINECEAMREYDRLDTLTATPRQLTLTALMLYNTNARESALLLLKKAAAGGNIQAANMAALIYAERDDVDSALECFQQALLNLKGNRLYMPVYHNIAYFLSVLGQHIEDADARKDYLELSEQMYTLYRVSRDLTLPEKRELQHTHYSPQEFIMTCYAEDNEDLDYILSGKMLESALDEFRTLVK